MASQSAPLRKQSLADLQQYLHENYSAIKLPELSVLDHVLLAVIQENNRPAKALAAYEQLRSSFADLNELRVSHHLEIETLLAGLNDPPMITRRIQSLLQFVYEATYSYDLESMRKKPTKQAQRQLAQINGVSDFVVAATIQRALAGSVVPVDAAGMKLLDELGILVPGERSDDLQELLESSIAKSKQLEFSLNLAELATSDAKTQGKLLAQFSKRKNTDGKDTKDNKQASKVTGKKEASKSVTPKAKSPEPKAAKKASEPKKSANTNPKSGKPKKRLSK